jgi:four helix bundle protein
MSEAKKIYDLEKRTKQFGLEVRDFCRPFKKDIINSVYINQIIRSSSSIGANYIEANENLGKNDLMMRIKICKKEAKETIYWLDFLIHENEVTKQKIAIEANELMLIFGSILKKLTNNN